METRTLPGTELALSVIGLGAWAMGGLWWGDDVRDADSVAAVQEALDRGINWVDTAPLYGQGHADAVLREALGERRHQVIVATKVGPRWDGPGGHAVCDLSPAHVRADVEGSLSRLGLDTLPLVQLHWPCEQGTPLAATLETLFALRDEGKLRYVGLCNYGPDEVRAARRLGPVVALQTPLSMVRREYEQGLEGACAETGMGVLAYEPLARGLLTGKFKAAPRFPDTDLRARDYRFAGIPFQKAARLVEGLGRIAAHFDLPPAALALAWVLRRPGVTAAIAGAKRPAQVAANARAAEALAAGIPWDVVDRMVDATRL